MQHISVNISEQIQFRTEDSRDVLIQPGVISGELAIRPFVDPLVCSEDMGYFSIELGFCDRLGDGLRYSAILGPINVWPCPDTKAHLCPDSYKDENAVVLKTVLDLRREYCIATTQGTALTGQLKYVDTTFWLKVMEGCINVVLRFYRAEDRGFRTISYDVPLSRLLWRRATVFYSDEFDPEGASHVSLVRDAALDGAFAPSPLDWGT